MNSKAIKKSLLLIKHFTFILIFFLVTFVLASAEIAVAGNTLKQVKDRGFVNCGVGEETLGFSIPNKDGKWQVFEVDFCRALAAAIFGNPNKVKFTGLIMADRFRVISSGAVDVLFATTTWSMHRDADLPLNFAAVNYYDGQGFMVRKDSGITSATQLNGKSVCVHKGTTTELNLNDFFTENNMQYTPITLETGDRISWVYDNKKCDIFISDVSGLHLIRAGLNNPKEHIILPDIISKEPLGAAVQEDDNNWFDIVKWSIFAMINAEELGVTSKNADEMLKSPKPTIKRLLGVEGNFGEKIGLSNNWAYQIIKHVGNYGEVFERNFGDNSSLPIDRGINNLWNNGGILYAPPIR